MVPSGVHQQIVFALNYGFNIMKDMGMELNTVRAGHANMFLSPLFREAFANITPNTDLLQDLKINSAHLVDIILDTEDAFDIEISDEDAERRDFTINAL